MSVSLDWEEKVKALFILKYLRNYDCETSGISSCSCGQWFPNYGKLIFHAQFKNSCLSRCFRCGKNLTEKEAKCHLSQAPICCNAYMEPPQAVESRIPSFLTCRAWAYLGMLKCHICSKEFDKKSDSIAVSHFIEDHNFLRHTAERITDLLFITPTVPNLKVLKVLQCFVCDTFVSSGVIEFKKHISIHKELVMLYECPYCFSLHESDHKMTLHSSVCQSDK